MKHVTNDQKSFRTAMLLGTIILSGYVHPLYAQSLPADTPAVRSPQDSNGVDLSTGKIGAQTPSVSIGPVGEGGLSFGRTLIAGEYWKDEYVGYILIQGTKAHVILGDRKLTFTNWYGQYSADQQNGYELSVNGSEYELDKDDGSTVYFSTLPNGGGIVADMYRKANGERVDVHYKVDSYCVTVPGVGQTCYPTRRIQSVTSTSAYQLKYTYQGNSAGSDLDAFHNLISVKAINRSIEYCSPSADSCTVASTWPEVTFAKSTSGNNAFYDVGDPSGNSTRFTFEIYSGTDQRLAGVRRPGSSTDDLVIAYDLNGRVASIAKPGGTTNYAFTLERFPHRLNRQGFH